MLTGPGEYLATTLTLLTPESRVDERGPGDGRTTGPVPRGDDDGETPDGPPVRRGGYDYLYGREDARRLDTDDEISAFIDDLREEEHHEREREEMYNIGDHHCTVRVCDRAVLLHFPQGEELGTVVTLDPEAASELNRFIALCLRELATTGQDIEHAPEWA